MVHSPTLILWKTLNATENDDKEAVHDIKTVFQEAFSGVHKPAEMKPLSLTSCKDEILGSLHVDMCRLQGNGDDWTFYDEIMKLWQQTSDESSVRKAQACARVKARARCEQRARKTRARRVQECVRPMPA